MNIYQKILEVMKDVQYLSKDDHIKFGQQDYKAVSEEKVTSTVRESLIKNGIVIIPVEQLHHREGTLSTVDVSYRIQNVEEPEDYIIAKSSGTGTDTQDKGVGKAMTYAYKYLLLRTFAIPTGEDPDKISSAELDKKEKAAVPKAKKQNQAPPTTGPQGTTCTANEINALHNEIVRAGGTEEAWLDFVGKHVKSGPKPKKLEDITKKEFVWSMEILGKRESKAAESK